MAIFGRDFGCLVGWLDGWFGWLFGLDGWMVGWLVGYGLDGWFGWMVACLFGWLAEKNGREAKSGSLGVDWGGRTPADIQSPALAKHQHSCGRLLEFGQY